MSPDLLVGTSAGAPNVAFVAGRGTSHAALRELADSWVGVHRRDILPSPTVRHLLAVARVRGSLCSEDGLRRLTARHLTFSRLEDATIPVHVATTRPPCDLAGLRGEGALCATEGSWPP